MLRKIMNGSYALLALFFAAGLIMSCGGGAGGGSNTGNATYTLPGTVTGVVQDGITITLSGAGTGTTTTSAGGTYSFSGLPNGYYTVTASLANYAFTPASRQAAINYGNAAAADFVSVDAYSISGTVTVTGIGGTSEGVTMTLTGLTLSAPVTTTTDSVGNYTFYRVVSNGTYTITPSQSRTRTVCSGGLNNSPGFPVTETTTFSPSQQSITINNADVTGVNYNGTFTRWTGVCPT
jgi:hypothetical protein